MSRTEANDSGKNSEAIIDCVMTILRKKGYVPVTQHVFKSNELRKMPLFTDTCRVDFFVRGIAPYESGLILSSKRQDSDGTAYEKLPYHIEHLIERCYPYPTILVMTGDKWSDRVKVYVRSKVDETRLVKVFFSYEELLKWAESRPIANQGSLNRAYAENLPLFDMAGDNG